MKPKQQAPYGSWSSPVNSQLMVTDSVSLDEVQLSNHSLYYLERRPQEQGRCVIVQFSDKKTDDILPTQYSARSRVHEYGGGAYCVHNNTVYFINDKDQDIYCIRQHKIQRITHHQHHRYADLIFDSQHNRLIAVCEQRLCEQPICKQQVNHKTGHDYSPVNSIVAINMSSGSVTSICTGYDFYASPRINPDGNRLCWLSWNQPNMPWDGTELWCADIDASGELQRTTHLAGVQSSSIKSRINISICQPDWSPDNQLYFISDKTGWWQLYRYETDKTQTLITSNNQDIGLPQWVFAQSSYAFINASQLLTHYRINNKHSLVLIDTLSITETAIESHWDNFSSIAANENQLAFIGTSPTRLPVIIQHTSTGILNINNLIPKNFNSVKASSRLTISTDYFSQAQTLAFKNRHQQTIYANYYAPTHPLYSANKQEKPPLIVICHGGPTGNTDTALDLKKQYWTSRGFALLDVNYSGSSGYGRKYRCRLNGKWGKLDVEDCCDAALFAVEHELADAKRLIIRGSSAGGYTVLCALTFHNVFSAGASYYGISELESLVTDTHKFESHYLDRLIGPYPEAKTIYQQRSPLYHSKQLSCPVIFFHGMDDRVVPKEQAEEMIAALDKNGIAVASHFFKGEQHGFRQAETIRTALDNELYFYSRLFGFSAPDGNRLNINNLAISNS